MVKYLCLLLMGKIVDLTCLMFIWDRKIKKNMYVKNNGLDVAHSANVTYVFSRT